MGKKNEVTHSPKYNIVKAQYDKGLWSKKRVHDAVTKEWITAEEYTEITGDPYEETIEDKS